MGPYTANLFEKPQCGRGVDPMCTAHEDWTGMKDGLLFRFPIPGNHSSSLFPSCQQVQCPKASETFSHGHLCNRCTRQKTSIATSTHYTYFGDFFEKTKITGLEHNSSPVGTQRIGNLIIESEDQKPLHPMVSAAHDHSIPNGEYPLVKRVNSLDFVVCSYSPPKGAYIIQLEKVSVLIVIYSDESQFKAAACNFARSRANFFDEGGLH